MKVAIVIPAHNEETRIRRTLHEYGSYFRDLKKKKILDFEIIVVLNACKDNTRGVVEDSKFPELRIVEFKRGGKGFAVIEGFKDALARNSDLIGFTDADLATPPASFHSLLNAINGYEGVIASRYVPGARISPPRLFVREVISRVFNFVVRSLFLLSVFTRSQCWR